VAATPKAVLVTLESIKWKNITVVTGGGGFQATPSVSPYLWTVFFKIDGTSVIMADDYNLVGTATVEPAQGAHGDLGIWSMSVGETVAIPDSLGFFSTSLQPFFIAVSAQPFFNAPGIPQPQAAFGCIVIVLKDGGHIPAHAVDAGRQALTNGVQNFLDSELSGKLGLFQPGIPEADLQQAQRKIADAITNAIRDSLSTLEKIWAVSGEDQMIASWIVSADAATPSFSKVISAGDEFSEFGVWELTVDVTITDPCPAEAAAGLIGAFWDGDGKPPSPAAGAGAQWTGAPLGAMREFRDSGALRERPALRQWWSTLRANTPDIVRLLARDERLRHAAAVVMKALPAALKAPTKPLDPPMMEALAALLAGAEEKGSPRLKAAAVNARVELAGLAKLPLGQMLDRAGQRPPARKPPPRGGNGERGKAGS